MYEKMLMAWILDLSAPVDVYADWVDACDAVAKQAAAGQAATSRSADRTGARARPEQDDFVVQDDLDAEGEYADD
jgi:transcription elongation factor Elf1